jgi:iron complex transport system substrate-binding protein
MNRISISTVFITIMMLLIGIFSGCGRNEENDKTTPDSASTRIITDMTGREVTIPLPKDIKRVAVQTSPQVLNMYVAGISDKLCAVTNAVKKWPLLAKADPRLKDVPATRAGNAQINIESLLGTRPDLCIGSASDMQAIEKMTKLPVLRISMGTPGAYFDGLKKEVAFFGTVFNKEERVKIYTDYLDNTIKIIATKTSDIAKENRLKVYMGFDADHLTTYGRDTFMDEWINASGCLNAAGQIYSPGGREGGLSTISMEQVVAWNPDVIIIDTGMAAELYERPGWSEIKAVKEKKVYRFPVGLFLWNRPSCEAAALFPEWLALAAYPERFKMVNIKENAMRFYHDVFGFDFSGDEIEKIYNP